MSSLRRNISAVGFPRRGRKTYANINASFCTRGTTRRNGIWSAARNRSSSTSRGRWPRDFDAVSAFTYRGHGVGLLPSTCDAQIARGELVRLLPDWSSPEIFVHAVYPTRRFLPAKLQVFLEHLKAWKSPLWIPLR